MHTKISRKPLKHSAAERRRTRACLVMLLAVLAGGCGSDKSPVLPVTAASVSVDKDPICLAPGVEPGTLLVACQEAGTVDVLSLAPTKVLYPLTVMPKPGFLLADAPHRLVYCLNPQSASISLLSGLPLKLEKNLGTGSMPVASAALRPGHDELWICDGVSALHVLTAGRLQLKRSLPLGRYPQHLAFSLDGSTAWVTLKGENALAAVDAESGKEIARVPVGIYPRDVVIAGTMACVSNFGSHDVSLVDTVKRAESARLPVRHEPNALTLQGKTLWVSCEDSYRLVAINVSQARVIGTIKTGFYPGDLEALPSGALAVCDPRHDQVVVFTPQTTQTAPAN
jgi:YVTN family beta-propeller protein